MAVITKKVDTEYFEAILSGRKTYELRLNDFEIEEGDILVLFEVDPNTHEPIGRKLEKKVGYVGRFKPEELTFWTQDEIRDKGFQIISLL